GSLDVYRAGLGVDRFGAALHVDNVDGLEDIQQWRRQGFGLGFVESRTNHERRRRGDQRDLELLGRNALDVAEAGGGKCGVHAGEAGAYDDKSHVIYSCGWICSEERASPPRLLIGDKPVAMTTRKRGT